MNVEDIKGYLGKQVEVEWEDIVAWGGWVGASKMGTEGTKPAHIFTQGTCSWIGDNYITISATYGGEGEGLEYNQHLTIPIGCILSIV